MCVCMVQQKPVGTCMHLYPDSQGFFWPSKTGQPIRWGRWIRKQKSRRTECRESGGVRGRKDGMRERGASRAFTFTLQLNCPGSVFQLSARFISFSLFEFFSSLYSLCLSELMATEREWEKWMLMKWKKVHPLSLRRLMEIAPRVHWGEGEREKVRERKKWGKWEKTRRECKDAWILFCSKKSEIVTLGI